MFYLIRNEPEGWRDAWLVMFAGKRVATFRYADSAMAYITDHFAENQ